MADETERDRIVGKVARGILKARFYDCEPEMYESLEAFFAEMDPEHWDGAREEARAALAITGKMLAKAIQCDCCDVCGESPQFEHVCANEIAARIRALTGAKEEERK
ncbi:MAG: hypothetical protein KGL39_56670 [Patescibacteria group bacterium]|nr:hypothetical protein [Patescibacteria group bacterium]